MKEVLLTNLFKEDPELPSIWGLRLLREVILEPDTTLTFLDDLPKQISNTTQKEKMTCFK